MLTVSVRGIFLSLPSLRCGLVCWCNSRLTSFHLRTMSASSLLLSFVVLTVSTTVCLRQGPDTRHFRDNALYLREGADTCWFSSNSCSWYFAIFAGSPQIPAAFVSQVAATPAGPLQIPKHASASPAAVCLAPDSQDCC